MFKKICMLTIILLFFTGCSSQYRRKELINGYSIYQEDTYIYYIDLTEISVYRNVVKRLAYDDRYIFIQTDNNEFVIVDAFKRRRVKVFGMNYDMFNLIIDTKGLELLEPQEILDGESRCSLLYEVELYKQSEDWYTIEYNDAVYRIETGEHTIPNKVIKIEYDNRYIYVEQLVSDFLYFLTENPEYEEGKEKINYWYIDTYERKVYGPYTYAEIEKTKRQLLTEKLVVIYPEDILQE